MRARQTPYPFHDLPAAEEEEEEEEVIHPMTVRKDHPCCDSALIQALIKRLIAQGDENGRTTRRVPYPVRGILHTMPSNRRGVQSD